MAAPKRPPEVAEPLPGARPSLGPAGPTRGGIAWRCRDVAVKWDFCEGVHEMPRFVFFLFCFSDFYIPGTCMFFVFNKIRKPIHVGRIKHLL